MRDFRNLEAWHKAHAFTLAVSRTTESSPGSEAFGLATALRPRLADIPMKLAGACGKDVHTEFASCLRQARGIGLEVEYQLLLAHDLQLIETSAYEVLRTNLIEVRKMASGLMKSIPV